MPFANGQNVQAADLNNFSVTTVTTAGATTVGGALGVTGATTLGALSATTGAFSGALSPAALVDISGAAAGQIKFPAAQNASTNANTLDDYEEGDWTPIIGGGGGQSGQAYTTQIGRYVKIGKLVVCQFRVQLSTLGTVTGSAGIGGLPFVSENTASLRSALAVGAWQNLTTPVVHLMGNLGENSTFITLQAATAAATGSAALLQADLSNTTLIDGSISYRASA